MNLISIKKLIKIIEDSSITDFSIEEKDLKITISKKAEIIHSAYHQAVDYTAKEPININATKTVEYEKNSTQDEKFHEICSPIVGTFYRAPSPEAEPYVQIGDHITEGKVMCLIEAMKLMNEIESDINGKIVKVLVENGSPVEYNQPLFLIKPD